MTVPPEELAFKEKTTSWIGDWRLTIFFIMTVAIMATMSSVYEFGIEKALYTHFNWPYEETLNERLRYVMQATAFTSLAIIGPAVLLFRSIKRLSHVQRLMQTALHTAETANIAKSQFLANMSHELRTPLNAVIGFADLMGTEPFGPLLPQYKSYAGDIRKAGLHLLDVINDVLDISKAEAVKLSVQLSNVDVGEIFSEVDALVAGLARNSAIALLLTADSRGGPIVASADRIRLKQVLLNLVSNAIKFNHAGGSVTVRAFANVDAIQIEVRDTGIGMNPSEIAYAFQPFVQLHTGHARKYQGTGLGLPLTKVLVEAMKGSIAVHSQVGVGSCITITLHSGVTADVARVA